MGTKTMQLCWDCKKACCGCMWSLAGEPIPGWTATPTVDANGVKSYLVTECPEFERDAWDGGTRRTPPLTDAEKAARRRERERQASKNKYRRMKEQSRLPVSSAGWTEAALRRAGGEE